MQRKILLFGTSGQLGWELQRTLAPLGNVIGLDFPHIDLNDYNRVGDLVNEIKPNLIVNAAAYTNVDKAESESEKARNINSLAVMKMAEIANRLGIGIIHYSTDYVFDGTKNSPYIENDTTNPLNVYGATKLEGELFIQSISHAYWIFRTSWVYSNRIGGFVNKVLEWAHTRAIVHIVDDQISNPTWCRMLAETTALALSQGRYNITDWIIDTKGLYHVAGSGYCSRYDWAEEIIRNDSKKELQKIRELVPAKTIDFSTPAERPLFSAMNQDSFNKKFLINLPDWKYSLQLMNKI